MTELSLLVELVEVVQTLTDVLRGVGMGIIIILLLNLAAQVARGR